MKQYDLGKATLRHLMMTTLLSSSALLLLPSAALAQLSCTPSNGTCTFSNGQTSLVPFAFDKTGANGTGSTGGAAGPSYTFVVDSDPAVTLGDSTNNPGSAANAVSVLTAGGAGSTDGPSPGGDGGDITFTAAPTSTYTISSPAFSGESPIATVYLRSLGGNGADNNTNDKSNGARGGQSGEISYDNGMASVTLAAEASGGSSANTLAALDALSQGGTGGRGNEGASFVPTGGAGGFGQFVKITSGQIQAGTSNAPLTGASLFGIRARSIGGRGPNGDNSSDGETQGGGGASNGGEGLAVTVTTNEQVNLYGRSTNGSVRAINAQSIGGDGGWAYNVDVSSGFTNGGLGGAGGEVTVVVNDTMELIQTGTGASTDQSALVFSLSQGGTGGKGQSGTTGGTGGLGSDFEITVSSEVVATDGSALVAAGTGVDGLFAKSIGGAGGPGLESANDSTGGQGQQGGRATVTVDIAAGQVIEARASSAGNDSGRAIVAQSIGNFGGEGSNGNAVFGSPGGPGAGGNGFEVGVTVNSGTLTTDGTFDAGSGLNFAHGILAQSIGGGGGDGGDFAGLFGGAAAPGGKGGTGGTVTVTNAGTINARGIHANGILAQSIGGGGGTGGIADAGLVALGGSGGTGGSSQTVNVTNSGTITTNGYGGIGILAQSIVGAGGAAGVADSAVSLGATAG